MNYPDRKVHARIEGDGIAVEVVRYDRQGRWYKETTKGSQVLSRHRLGTVRDAVEEALEMEAKHGEILTGVPGGSHFDYCVEAAHEKAARGR